MFTQANVEELTEELMTKSQLEKNLFGFAFVKISKILALILSL
jgi:hypothetical protein